MIGVHAYAADCQDGVSRIDVEAEFAVDVRRDHVGSPVDCHRRAGERLAFLVVDSAGDCSDNSLVGRGFAERDSVADDFVGQSELTVDCLVKQPLKTHVCVGSVDFGFDIADQIFLIDEVTPVVFRRMAIVDSTFALLNVAL